MTAVLPGLPQPFLGSALQYQMPDNADRSWDHQQYFDQMPTLTSQWADGRAPAMGGMQDVDLRMFDNSHNHYQHPLGHGNVARQVISPSVGYHGDRDWATDVDMNTPSTAGFSTEATEGYIARTGDYLRPPTSHGHGSIATQSPQSVHSGISPRSYQAHDEDPARTNQRPALFRSITAPEPHEPTGLKRTGSEDEDEEFVPVKGRGRKRQRIPHTAVERRYRENLNAHLDKLRQSVPTLAARGPSTKGTGSGQEGVKPSKCEILNGAIEHITALDRENKLLRDELKMLKSQGHETDTRYPQGSAFGA